MIRPWHKYFTTCLTICIGWGIFFDVSLASTAVEGIQVYQKNDRLTEQRKQSIAEDINRFNSAENLWDVLRQEFTLPHYEDNFYVQEQIHWIMNHQDYLTRSATRAAPYLFYILQQVHKRHLPAELALLPMFESAYNPFAYSSAGAAGIWQMMPGTASGYGIKQNWWYDGRRDVVASTKAALDYLVYLGNFFEGNWLLSIAAYDTGEGSVLSSIKKNVRIGMNTDFWSLPLSQETRDYVPRLLALATIIGHPEKYHVVFPYLRNAPYLAEVDVGSQIALQHAATLAGLSRKQLMQLNPGFNHNATDPNGPHHLVLPIENVEEFVENLARSPQNTQQIHWVRYKVKSGDSLASIAKHFKTTPDTLRKTNNLALGHPVKRGLNLIIPKAARFVDPHTLDEEQTTMMFGATTPSANPVPEPTTIPDTAEESAPPKNITSLQAGDTIYMVRSGDDLEKIARRFHLSAKIIATANQLSRHKTLAIGKKLLIPTHLAKFRAKQYKISPGDTVYMVRKGDTVEKVAARFHLAPATIRIANLLVCNDLVEGDRLVIPTHAEA